ncbi:sensor histidine kinase [Isoptericola haloaureus]|uniref:histidine kinase n=1 Tax=Isoptericola haloaureus TaxID=1542902 RepID=A0ABU7Z466_9MICO
MSSHDTFMQTVNADRRWVAPAVLAAVLGLFLLNSPLSRPIAVMSSSQDGVVGATTGRTSLLVGTSWLDTSGMINLVSVATGLSCVTAVVLARRRPFTATALAAWPFVTIPLLGQFVWGWWLALLMITCLVVQDSWRRAAVPLVATLATAWWYVVSDVPAMLPIGPVTAGSADAREVVEAGVLYTVAVAVVVGAAAAIRLVRESWRRSDRAAAVEQHALEVESVATERARLARDLHDVVAHHVSLVAVRAESAPYTHPDLDANARRVLAEIADDARSALGELRQVLSVLQRTEGSGRAPQPTACDVAGLVDEARAAGQDVTLTGDCDDVPDAPGYVLYRAAQEALTNARRHAPGSPTTVELTHAAQVAGLRVTNPVDRADAVVVPGRGLTGMHERVEALGGTLTAGVEASAFVLVVALPTDPDHGPTAALPQRGEIA